MLKLAAIAALSLSSVTCVSDAQVTEVKRRISFAANPTMITTAAAAEPAMVSSVIPINPPLPYKPNVLMQASRLFHDLANEFTDPKNPPDPLDSPYNAIAIPSISVYMYLKRYDYCMHFNP